MLSGPQKIGITGIAAITGLQLLGDPQRPHWAQVDFTLMRNCRGFTLVELSVVVLILGILATIAAPKLLDTADKASDNCIRKSLRVVRDAIDRFTAEHGRLPGEDGSEATFKADLASHIRTFPVLNIGRGPAQDDEVVMDASTDPPAGERSPSKGWRYYYKTGAFIVNSNKKLESDSTITYDQL